MINNDPMHLFSFLIFTHRKLLFANQSNTRNYPKKNDLLAFLPIFVLNYFANGRGLTLDINHIYLTSIACFKTI